MIGFVVFAVLLGALLAVAQGVVLAVRRLRSHGRHRQADTPATGFQLREIRPRRRCWQRRP